MFYLKEALGILSPEEMVECDDEYIYRNKSYFRKVKIKIDDIVNVLTKQPSLFFVNLRYQLEVKYDDIIIITKTKKYKLRNIDNNRLAANDIFTVKFEKLKEIK